MGKGIEEAFIEFKHLDYGEKFKLSQYSADEWMKILKYNQINCVRLDGKAVAHVSKSTLVYIWE